MKIKLKIEQFIARIKELIWRLRGERVNVYPSKNWLKSLDEIEADVKKVLNKL